MTVRYLSHGSFVYTLQVAAKTLPFYKDYFNVPYPLPKIDLIAIADFAAGKVNFVLLMNCNNFEFYNFEDVYKYQYMFIFIL